MTVHVRVSVHVCVSVRDSLVDFNLSRHLLSRGEKGWW